MYFSYVSICLAVSGISCDMQGLLVWCTGFCLVVQCGLWSMGLVVAVRGLSPATCGISVPQPGIKLAFPALEDRFLNTEPPV